MRYAIYLTPPPSEPLTAAAEAWLGRSAFGHPVGSAVAPTAARAEVPARYGFHATMRAPFHLNEDADEAALVATFEKFAAAQGTFLVALELSRLASFLALTARDADTVAAAHRAALAVFEPLRAPLSAADLARRNPETLDARGRALLDTYGYPYVEERFTFHMTLSGSLPDETFASVQAAAATHFAPFIGPPQPLVFALYVEREPNGPFTVLRHPSQPKAAAS